MGQKEMGVLTRCVLMVYGLVATPKTTGVSDAAGELAWRPRNCIVKDTLRVRAVRVNAMAGGVEDVGIRRVEEIGRCVREPAVDC